MVWPIIFKRCKICQLFMVRPIILQEEVQDASVSCSWSGQSSSRGARWSCQLICQLFMVWPIIFKRCKICHFFCSGQSSSRGARFSFFMVWPIIFKRCKICQLSMVPHLLEVKICQHGDHLQEVQEKCKIVCSDHLQEVQATFMVMVTIRPNIFKVQDVPLQCPATPLAFTTSSVPPVETLRRLSQKTLSGGQLLAQRNKKVSEARTRLAGSFNTANAAKEIEILFLYRNENDAGPLKIGPFFH